MPSLEEGMGIIDLPHEILLKIFKIIFYEERLLVEGQYPFSISVYRLSAVCRQFRDIFNSNSIFWHNIDACMTPEQVDAHLARSKENRLLIKGGLLTDTREGRSWGSVPESLHFQKQVIPHRHRWGNFCLHYKGCDENMLGTVTEKYQGLYLPNLTKFTMRIEDTKDGDTPDSKVHFYTTWDAPLLRVLCFWNMIPQALNNIQLESLTINIDSLDWRRSEDPLATLMTCLASQPSLERLSFNIIGFPKETGHPVSSQVTLPRLRELDVGIEDSYKLNGFSDDNDDLGTSFAVAGVLARLVTPALEDLRIGFVITKHQSPPGSEIFDIMTIFPQFTDYDNVKRLRLYVLNTPEVPWYKITTSTLYGRMRKLQGFEW